jgi:iron complex outermembrane receptor protein
MRLFSGLLLLCLPMLAAAGMELDEDAYLGEMPTVLTVSRLAQPVDESPSAVTLIDEDMIRASGAVQLADILRLVPGMYVGQDAGYTYTVNPTVSYHGLTDAYSRRMQVLVDGRSVYSPIYGGVQWSDIPLAIEDIARIEVTRGPNSASYGANSFLGVINIITKHPSETLGNTVVATAGTNLDSVLYRHGGQVEDLQYRWSVKLENDSGLDNRVDDKRVRMFNARADYRLSTQDELEFQLGYNGGARQEGLLAQDSILFLPRTKQVSSQFEQINWRRTLDAQSEFRLQAYHARDTSDDQVDSIDLSTLNRKLFLPGYRIHANHDVTADRYDIEAQHTFAPSEHTRLAWGGNLRLDRTDAPLFLGRNNPVDFRLGRLFAHLAWTPIPQLAFNAGAMLEDNSFTGTDVTPRASVNFKLAPGHTLRASISTATRTPTLLEEKFDTRFIVPTKKPGLTLLDQLYLTQGNLSPERILSREIGYQGLMGRLSVDARVFYDRITDLITGFRRSPFPYESGLTPYITYANDYHNSSNVVLHGFEAQLQLRLGAQSRIVANYAHVRINPDMDATFTSTGEDTRFRELSQSMPQDSFSLLAWHRFTGGWSGSVGYYQNGEAKMPGDGTRVDFERHWDMRLAKSFTLGTTRQEVALISRNVFDHRYEEFAHYNSLGRETYLQYRVDF